MLQDSKFDYADSLVEEFHTSMKALWDKAASSTDGIENSTNYMYDQVSASGDFAFGSPYGYHAVVVTKFHNPTEKPTEAEFNLYREASVLESAKDSIKSVDEALANENVKTNRTLRSSYHAQKKLAELTIQKQVEAIKKLVGSEITVDTNYEMPKELKAKINRWIEEVHEHDEEGKETTPEETTCPDVEEHTASIVILKLMNKVKQDNEAGLIKAGNAEGMKFNQESFARYIQSVIDEYTTAE